jgi:hypothetical protein
MQNWSQPGTGRAVDSETDKNPAQTVPDPPEAQNAQDEPADWDELTPPGTGQMAPAHDVLVAGGPLQQQTDEIPEEPPVAAPESGHGGGKTVLESSVADEFQTRWRDVQFGFVDNPQGAVQRADELAAEVLDAYTAALSARKQSLDDEWGTGIAPDTERLRLAVRAYREFVDRLLNS